MTAIRVLPVALLLAAVASAAHAQDAPQPRSVPTGGVEGLLLPGTPQQAPVANPLAQGGYAPQQQQGGYAPQQAYAPPQGGYAPPQGGYAQPQGGYPQQQGYAQQGGQQPAPRLTGQAGRDAAFQKALREAVPLSPGQIREYRTEVDRARKETVRPLYPSAPTTRSVRLTLKPGEETPLVRVQPGQVSTLTFSDLTGAPWPVLSVVTGNPSAFVAQPAGEEGKTNIIVVSPTQEHVSSNLVITLAGYPVPVTMVLAPDQPQVDYRLDVRVEARGPNAAQEIVGVSSLNATDDSTMVKFLDGTPPNGARRLETSTSDVEAWRFENRMYVRTRGDLLSPAYTGRSSSVSGVNVFVMADAPVVLLSSDGQISQVRVRR